MLAGFAVIVGQKEILEACESRLKHPPPWSESHLAP